MSKHLSPSRGLNLLTATAFAAVLMMFAFTLLTIASYFFPAELVKQNVADSVRYQTTDAASVVDGDYWTYQSGSTTAIILTMISHGGEDPIRDAMLGKWYRSGNGAMNWVLDGLEEAPNQTYERYWNGWIAILRPLFTIMNYGQIKQLLWVAFLILLAMVSIVLQQKLKRGRAYAVVLCIALIVVAPYSVGNIVYCWVILLSLCSTLWVLNRFQNLGG